MSQQPDINLHSQPTIITVEDCFLPQRANYVEKVLKEWERDGPEVLVIVFSTWGTMARAEVSGN